MRRNARAVSQTVINGVLGLLGACLIVADALPLRDGGHEIPLGWLTLAMGLTLMVLIGVSLGRRQRRLATQSRGRWALATTLAGVVGLAAYTVATTLTSFTRVMPVPGGGEGVDPTLGDLKMGLIFWSAFIVSAMAGTLLDRVAGSGGPA